MHPFPTVSAIVDQIINTWPAEELELIRFGWDGFFGNFSRRVRNEFGLWHDHPLTEKWRTNESSRDIRENIDYSPDHPDNLTATILQELVKRMSGG